jgi:hypothetical protein
MDSDEERTNELDSYSKNIFDSHTLNQHSGITIAIFSRETRGSGIKKHTVYLIKGNDRNGSFEVWRRFSEFS